MADFSSNGKGNLGVTLGAIGTGLSVLNNGSGILGGILGNGTQYATKESLEASIAMAQKDSEIALLKANAESERKMIDVYERVQTNLNAFKDEQRAINANQAVFNSTATSSVSVLNNQVTTLQAMLTNLTKVVIPADNVCPKPMPQYNSWTAPTNP